MQCMQCEHEDFFFFLGGGGGWYSLKPKYFQTVSRWPNGVCYKTNNILVFLGSTMYVNHYIG